MSDANFWKNSILGVMAAFGSFVANQLGGWDASMKVLVALMAADYITGLLVAGVFHRSVKTESGALSSRVCFIGLVKKCLILMLVWLGVMLDKALGCDYVRLAVVLFFIGNEGLSLLENVGLMGVPYPAFLRRMLEALRDKGDGGDGDAGEEHLLDPSERD